MVRQSDGWCVIIVACSTVESVDRFYENKIWKILRTQRTSKGDQTTCHAKRNLLASIFQICGFYSVWIMVRKIVLTHLHMGTPKDKGEFRYCFQRTFY